METTSGEAWRINNGGYVDKYAKVPVGDTAISYNGVKLLKICNSLLGSVHLLPRRPDYVGNKK